VAKLALEGVCRNSSFRPDFRSVPIRRVIFNLHRLVLLSTHLPHPPVTSPFFFSSAIVNCGFATNPGQMLWILTV
jgi:hypothetical protein